MPEFLIDNIYVVFGNQPSNNMLEFPWTIINHLIVYGVYDYDKEHLAGATGQQRMLTPPWHLILPQSFKRTQNILFCKFYQAPNLPSFYDQLYQLSAS
uniref:Uncharacterized protein n=1 Tax=Magallana gigas TaxID=29159 RepID=K1PAB0_MAGGI